MTGLEIQHTYLREMRRAGEVEMEVEDPRSRAYLRDLLRCDINRSAR